MLTRLIFGYLAGLFVSAAAHGQTQLSPMVPLFHRWQMQKGPAMVAELAKPENGARQVQFTLLMLAQLDEKFRVLRWGSVWEKPKEAGGIEYDFVPVNEEMRGQIRDWLAAAFKAAVDAKLDIAVLCQVDSHGKIQEWRNSFDFDPAAQIQGYSYEGMMTRTVLEALEQAVPSDWPVELALEGEMGKSLFTYPKAWQDVLKRTKARGKLSNLRVGISANYENSRGQVVPDEKQKVEMNALIAAADFVGISCYAKVSVPPTVEDFVETVKHFTKEWSEVGCPIPKEKALRFTEVGLGGGGFDSQWKLTVPSPTVEGMRRAAFFGTDDVAKNPWKSQENIDFRRQWYKVSTEFLTKKHTDWSIVSAYLWSYGSFDPHGLEQREFRDEMIVDLIRKHNTVCAPEKKRP